MIYVSLCIEARQMRFVFSCDIARHMDACALNVYYVFSKGTNVQSFGAEQFVTALLAVSIHARQMKASAMMCTCA